MSSTLLVLVHLTNSKIHRKVARELRETSPTSNAMEDELRKMKSDLGQCNRRFGSLLTKLQDLVGDEQVQNGEEIKRVRM